MCISTGDVHDVRSRPAPVRLGQLLLLAVLVIGVTVSPAAAEVDAPGTGEDVQAEYDGGSLSVDPLDAAGGLSRRETLIASVTIFVLAIFVGIEVISKVPPTLHTPLMSGSNAISGITLVGALLATGANAEGLWIPLLGTMAIVMATVNVAGGFLVTHRMLSMFRRK